jgi:hypothetical protein
MKVGKNPVYPLVVGAGGIIASHRKVTDPSGFGIPKGPLGIRLSGEQR